MKKIQKSKVSQDYPLKSSCMQKKVRGGVQGQESSPHGGPQRLEVQERGRPLLSEMHFTLVITSTLKHPFFKGIVSRDCDRSTRIPPYRSL